MRLLPIILTVFVLGMTGYFVIPFRHDVVDPHRFDDLFAEAGQRYEVHPALVKAVAWQESRFDADAEGGVGELGLMQLSDMASFEWADAEGINGFRPGHLIHPKTNTLAGAFYLSKMLGRYQEKDQPVVYALADYNAGRKAVLDWMADDGATNSTVFLQQMDFPGTKKYIHSVIGYFEEFQMDFEPELPAESVIDFETLAAVTSTEEDPTGIVE